MPEVKYLSYGLVGFSGSQILGILLTGYGVGQTVIIFLILCVLSLIPGALYWGGRQAKTFNRLTNAQILSCFTPSLIVISILSIGFIIGVIVGI